MKIKARLFFLLAGLAAVVPGAQAFQLDTPPSLTSAENDALNIMRYPVGPYGGQVKLIPHLGKIPDVSIGCHPDDDPTIISACLGSPGLTGCVTPDWFGGFHIIGAPCGTNIDSGFYCTAPNSNRERIDSYDTFAGGGHPIDCDLPKATCDSSVVDSISNSSFYRFSPTPQQTTFYFTSDIHPYRGTMWLPANTIEHVHQINNLPGGLNTPNFSWAYTGDAIRAPSGVVLGGDIGKTRTVLGAFRLLFERTISASLKFPLFLGLGNHDISTGGDSVNAHRLFDYLTNRMGGCSGISQDPASGNYSWDWGRLHLVMLNTWANDTSVDYNPGSRGGGLEWLTNDLRSNVGISGRPVILFQHYEFSGLSFGDPGSADPPQTWWTRDNATDFLNVIADYNIAGIFAGHTHNPAVNRLDNTAWPDSTHGPVLRDSAGNEKVIDIFTNGQGGSAGSGDVIAIRYTDGGSKDTDPYLDVQSMHWDNTNGMSAILGNTNGFNNNYYGGKDGCRKRIDTRFNDITRLVNVSMSSGHATIANPNHVPLPKPLALQYQSSWAWLSNADFADSCGVASGSSSLPSSSYILLSDDQVNSLNDPNGSRSVAIETVLTPFGTPGPESFELVALTPLTGSSSSSLDPLIPGSNATSPKFPTAFQQSFTVFGQPGKPFSIICQYYNPPNPIGPQVRQTWASLPAASLNLISPTPLPIPSPVSGTALCDGTTPVGSSTFDTTGRGVVIVNIDANQETIVNHELPSLTLTITSTSNPRGVVASVIVTPHLATAVTVGVTIAPAGFGPHNPGGPLLFTATLYDQNGNTPPTVPNLSGEGGVLTPSGLMTLNDATLDASGNIVSLNPLTFGHVGDSGRDCGQLYNNQISGSFPGNHSQVVFGDTGSPGFCPSIVPKTGTAWAGNFLLGGLHHLVVTYSGDGSNFGPAQTAVFDYVVAAVSSISANSGGGQSTLVGTPFAQPLQAHVSTSYPASTPPGIQVTFTAPSSGAGGFFPGNVQSATVLTDATGAATAPVLNANLISGPYQVTASLPGLGLSTVFNLTNTPVAGTPLLTATVSSKTGNMNARVWTMKITNTQAGAIGAAISSVAFTQVAGTACTPVVRTPLPVALGDILNGASASAPVTIDFSACAATARFTVQVGVQANSGAYQRTTTIGNQFP